MEQGTLLHDAIQQADVSLALPCGGQGRCGRCQVIVRRGQVRRRSVLNLTPGKVAQGYALACQTVIESDIVVFVPPEQAAILASPEAVSEGEELTAELMRCRHDSEPWVKKYHLVIEPPSLDDNTTDLERVKRELARQYGIRDFSTSLAVMRRLAGVLREANWDVTVVLERCTWCDQDALPRLLDIRPGDTTERCLAIAVDIGTTTNVVYLVDLAKRRVLGRALAYNRQISCGEDVISRIIYAKREGGLEHLQDLVVKTINGLIYELLVRYQARREDLYHMTVAGNPTMIHLFLGLDPQYIRLEPYVPTANQPVPVRGADLGLHIHPEASVDCLPGVGAYVGADITAGVLRTGMTESSTLTLFIDIGTNGEMVLGNNEWLICCACSAGPAFEGAGVVSGMRATDGAIQEVWINRHTAEPTYHTIGDVPPKGICGSGIISLLGELFMTGIIDRSGHLNRGLDTPRIRDGEYGPEYVVAWAAETADGVQDIVFTEVDIQNIMRAKAAIYAGMMVLTESVGLRLEDIDRVLIGGAFGKYIDVEKAIDIGLLPDMPWERFTYLGNTSVQGACLSLLCSEHRRMVSEIAAKMTYLELSADNSFMNAFTSSLFLPHTDLSLFPTVRRKLEALEETQRIEEVARERQATPGGEETT